MVPFFCAGISPLAGRDAKFLHGFSASLQGNRPRFWWFLWTGGWFWMCRPRLGVFLWLGVWLSGDPSMFLAVFVDGSVSYMLVVFIETLVSWSGVGVPEGNSCQPFEYIGAA